MCIDIYSFHLCNNFLIFIIHNLCRVQYRIKITFWKKINFQFVFNFRNYNYFDQLELYIKNYNTIIIKNISLYYNIILMCV